MNDPKINFKANNNNNDKISIGMMMTIFFTIIIYDDYDFFPYLIGNHANEYQECNNLIHTYVLFRNSSGFIIPKHSLILYIYIFLRKKSEITTFDLCVNFVVLPFLFFVFCINVYFIQINKLDALWHFQRCWSTRINLKHCILLS